MILFILIKIPLSKKDIFPFKKSLFIFEKGDLLLILNLNTSPAQKREINILKYKDIQL